MKSQALKIAWVLFRRYQITFSEALIDAWKRVKREFLRLEFKKTFPDEVTYRQKLVDRFNALAPSIFLPRNYNPQRQIVDLKLDGRYESWMQ